MTTALMPEKCDSWKQVVVDGRVSPQTSSDFYFNLASMVNDGIGLEMRMIHKVYWPLVALTRWSLAKDYLKSKRSTLYMGKVFVMIGWFLV